MEVGDPTNFDAMRAKVASSYMREECVQAHSVSGELGLDDEVHHNEPGSNGVSKDDSVQSAVLDEGKPSNFEPQGACSRDRAEGGAGGALAPPTFLQEYK